MLARHNVAFLGHNSVLKQDLFGESLSLLSVMVRGAAAVVCVSLSLYHQIIVRHDVAAWLHEAVPFGLAIYGKCVGRVAQCTHSLRCCLLTSLVSETFLQQLEQPPCGFW